MSNKAYFGGGCFWCLEAVFQRLKGVEKVVSGYGGGEVDNPSYSQVSSGTTGHAEVVEISFNPEIITYQQLLEVFFATHDPTTLNRQGNDVGSQYRSIILYIDDEQKDQAEQIINQLNKQVFAGKIVTEVMPIQQFYKAEDYHQNYYNNNTGAGYCQVVIDPKVSKLQAKYSHLMK